MAAAPAYTAQGLPVVAATPSSNPPAGQVWVYAKSDLKVYTLDSAGTETQIGAGSSAQLGRSFFLS